MTRLRAALGRYALDVLAIAGWILVAAGAARVPGGWGDVLGPVVLGLGLLATVRFGSR